MGIRLRHDSRTTFWALVLASLTLCHSARADSSEPPRKDVDRSPVALALSPDGHRLLTANQTSDSVSLVDLGRGSVLGEITTGEKPSGVAFTPDGKRAVVTHWYGYDLVLLEIDEPGNLQIAGRVEVGPEPRGVVVSPDGSTAYVAVGVRNELVRVDLGSMAITGRLTVDREPRGVALSPDGTTLAVSNARAGTVSLIDRNEWKLLRSLPIDGVNLRQITFGPDGQFAYVANMHNRGFSTTRNNIDVGWVLGQRLTRVPVDGSGDFATLSLDPQGQAASDAHGAAISGDGVFLAVSLGGTHEVMLFRTDGRRLPWRTNGSRDLIDPQLLRDDGRFRRIPLGGRPTEIVFAPDNHRLYVANYLKNAVQVIDAQSASLIRSIPLGGPESPSLARKGEILFHDAKISFNQWYSCNTCHSDGHTNGQNFDTMNDGWQDRSTAHLRSRKKVPTLRRVTETGPWTWHGWQTSLEDSISESITQSMQGDRPSSEEIQALVAYLETLEYPRNPNDPTTESAKRGEEVFRSSKAACNTCHGGPEMTDGDIYKVGLGETGDVYEGHNPPSLKGLLDKDPYLHDGRAPTLEDALKTWHDPEEVTGLGELTDQEFQDLITYLKTL